MSAPSSFAPPRLELRGISKRYPGCLANDRIDLCIDAGEIHALLGENGAGKSTLMKIIYGVTRPDAGEVRWQGEPVQVRDPARARALGIGMVFQHFSLFETLSVAENIALALGAEAGSPRRLEARIREVSQRYGMPLEPRRLVHGLSIGERQRVEIVRCLMQDIRLLILDEPTSVLTPREAEDLFVTLRRLAEEGCSVLFISHKLAEVRALCQRATVLRGGRVAGQCVPAQCSDLELARLMVGDAEGLAAEYPKATGGAPFLQVRDLHWRNPDPFGVSFAGLDLEVRSGEILGIAGVAGNGQDELLALLSGEVRLPRAQAERIRLGGCAGAHLAPDARRRAGQAFVPAERLGHGAVSDMILVGQCAAHRLPAWPGAARVGPAAHGAGAGLGDHPPFRREGPGCRGRRPALFSGGNPADVHLRTARFFHGLILVGGCASHLGRGRRGGGRLYSARLSRCPMSVRAIL
ncbi:ATP-binding component of ABC transporter, partial [Pseudomonas aeruginosa 2192]